MPEKVVMIHDLEYPGTGRSYKQVNTEKSHNFPIGSLVELENGCRLFVVKHGRDCDMTPLYYLSVDKGDIEQEREGFINRSWVGGYSEYGLRLIKQEPKANE